MTAEKERPTTKQEELETEKRPTLFVELQTKIEDQRKGLEGAFRKSFEEYAKNNRGEYPDLQTSKDVDSYVGARRDLWNSIQHLDMVLRDVARTALKVLDDLEREQSSAKNKDKEA